MRVAPLGKTADFSTRDVERVVVGLHLPNWHFFETYKRMICVDIRSQRTIFSYAGTFNRNNGSSLVEEAGAFASGAHRNMKFFLLTEAHRRAVFSCDTYETMMRV